jgi:hypothetical protein
MGMKWQGIEMQPSVKDKSPTGKVRGIHLFIVVAVPLLFFAAVMLFRPASAIRYGILGLAVLSAVVWVYLLRRAVFAYRSGVMRTSFGLITREGRPFLFGAFLWLHVLIGPLLGGVVMALLIR